MKKLWKNFFRQEWLQDIIPQMAWFYLALITKTFRYQVEGEEHFLQLKKAGQPVILACWHGGLVPPMYYLRGQGIYVLSSTHRDSEYLAVILQKFGWRLIKGSTGRGGAKAFIEMMHKVRAGAVVAMTPDGPTGPAHQLKPGLIQLAKKTGAAIIPLGVAAAPKKNLKTWDSFLLPGFRAQTALVFGQPFRVEAEADEEELLKKSNQMESILNTLDKEAAKRIAGPC